MFLPTKTTFLHVFVDCGSIHLHACIFWLLGVGAGSVLVFADHVRL